MNGFSKVGMSAYPLVQCAAVRAYSSLRSEQPQRNEPLLNIAPWCGNCPLFAGIPPIIASSLCFRTANIIVIKMRIKSKSSLFFKTRLKIDEMHTYLNANISKGAIFPRICWNRWNKVSWSRNVWIIFSFGCSSKIINVWN